MAEKGTSTNATTITCLRLEAGESLYLGHPRCPESKTLVQGQHFEFLPPYKGRSSEMGLSRDSTSSAMFTALVPLLLAVHGLWESGQGCQTIGHVRMARPYGVFRLAGDASILDSFRHRTGAKEAGYPEHLVKGGLRNAVIYDDETVIPAYRWDKRQDLPFCHIVERADLLLLTEAFGAGARLHHQAKSGVPTKLVGIQSASTHRIKILGPTTLRYDKVGRIHGIEQIDPITEQKKILTFLRFQNGISVRVGEIATDNRLREKLEIDLLPVVGVAPAVKVLTPGGVKTDGMLSQVRSGPATPKAVPKAVPVAVRRTSAPKLSEISPQPEPSVEVTPVVAPAPKPVNPLVGLMVEAFAGVPLPALSYQDGTVVAAAGAAMTEEIAAELVSSQGDAEHGDSHLLVLTPDMADFFTRFGEVMAE